MQIAVEFDRGKEQHLPAVEEEGEFYAEVTSPEVRKIVAWRLETDAGGVCRRTVRAPRHAIVIQAGDSYTLGFQLSS